MIDLLPVLLAGFAASLVDGSLGMGFGPTSSTVLLGAGLPPTSVSATVNVAKVAAGAAGGAAHWRLGNVDRTLVARLAVPGCVGAVIGVTALGRVDGEALRPALALLLLLVAIRILVRAGRPVGPLPSSARPAGRPRTDDPGRHDADPDGSETPARRVVDRESFPADRGDGLGAGGARESRRVRSPAIPREPGIAVAGLVGGVTNGLIGSWGPIVTPAAMARRATPTGVAVGTVNVAEIAVAGITTGAFLVAAGTGGVDPRLAGGLLVGGVLAAPVSAHLVRRAPARVLAVGVGLMLGLVNLQILAACVGLGGQRWLAYALLIGGAAAAARSGAPDRRSIGMGRGEQAERAEGGPTGSALRR